MADHTRKCRREMEAELGPLGFVYDGQTKNSHHRWKHCASGRILITGFNAGNWRTVRNTVRTAKEMLRRIGETPTTQ